MVELLRDPLWQFVGVALAIAALGASFLIYSWQRARRSVTYDVVSWTRLLTIGEELTGKVQVLYEGEPAKSLTLLTVKVWNSGNQALLATDFERPIAFVIDSESRFLSAAVIETEPCGISAGITADGNCVVLTPSLLNPSDSITVKLLVRDMGRRIWPDARIVGVKAVKLVRDSTRPGFVVTTVGVAFFFVAFYLGDPGFLPRDKRSILVFFAIGLGYMCLVWGQFSLRNARRRNARLVRPQRESMFARALGFTRLVK